MRILSGVFKGRYFYMPYGIRPTSDIIRKSVFDTLGQSLEGVSFLDLFAGSGAMGLEALSRGAKRVIWVEKERKCIQVIEENMMLLISPAIGQKQSSLDVVRLDAFAAMKNFHKLNHRFDIIFIDPPYSRELAKKALKTLCAYDILHPNSYVVVQHAKREVLPEELKPLSVWKRKKYGASYLTFYQKNEKQNCYISGNF